LCVADRLRVYAVGHRRCAGRAQAAHHRHRHLRREARRRRPASRGIRDLNRQDARVPGTGVPRRRAHAGAARDALALRIGELLMQGLTFDIAHLLAGSLVLVSFIELYQDRLSALINIFAIHALVLAASVAWQATAQGAPHLYVTAVLAL